MRKGRYLKFFSIGFMCLCVVINIFTLKNGHNWGDDFAQYIIHAENIIQGVEYEQGITKVNSVVYPPGYPLILSLIIKMFGVDFLIMKFLNILFWYGFIFLIYRMLCREINKSTSILLCGFLSSSPFFFIYKQNILSDIPFLFFTIFSIYCINLLLLQGGNLSEKRAHYWVLLLASVVLMGFSFLIRSAGLMLFLSLITYLIFFKKKYFESIMVIVGLLIFMYIQGRFFVMQQGFMVTIMNHGVLSAVVKIISFSHKVFSSMFVLFCPVTREFFISDFLQVERVFRVLGPIIYAALFVMMIIKIKNKSFKFLDCFFAFYLVMLVVWSFFDATSVVFSRFLLPLMYPLFLYLYQGVFFLFKNKNSILVDKKIVGCVNIFLIILISMNIYSLYSVFDFNDDVLYVTANQELFSWVRGNIDEDERYMFSHARALSLMTDREGIAFWMIRINEGGMIPGELIEVLKKYKIKYAICPKKTEKKLENYLSYSQASEKKWENSLYSIFLIN